MKSFEPGAVIYREGEAAAEMFFITKGTVIARFKGQEIELGAGNALGDAGMIEGVYWATAEAGTAGCNLMVLPCEELRAQIEKSPPLVRAFVEAMLKRTENTVREIL